MLKTRILSALVLLPAFLAALFYLPPFLWEILMLAVVLLAAQEWGRLAGYSTRNCAVYLAATLLLLALLRYFYPSGQYIAPIVVAVFFWLVIAPLWLKFRWQIKQPLLLAIVGWIVLAPTWIAAVQLRSYGANVLLFVMGMVWVADSAAYFSGRRWGRHKLAPAISPGKTWEGAAGALAAVAVYGVLFLLARRSGAEIRLVELLYMIIVLWLLTAVSILGDLFESLMKRQAGIKDSGSLIPGHGGVLDRIDSLTAVLPVALGMGYLFLYGKTNLA